MSNCNAAATEAASSTLFEVWDKVRCCVVGCFTSHEAAAALIEPNGLSENCEIREYEIEQ